MNGLTDSGTLRELERMRLTWHAKGLANAMAIAAAVRWELPMGRPHKSSELPDSSEDNASVKETS
jgi:hypothetical protein